MTACAQRRQVLLSIVSAIALPPLMMRDGRRLATALAEWMFSQKLLTRHPPICAIAPLSGRAALRILIAPGIG